MYILRKFAKLLPPPKKKKTGWSFFGKVVGLQHPNLLNWNLTMSFFLEITDLILIDFTLLYGILPNTIDKFCSSPLVIFLNMTYIFMQVIGNRKTFHRLSIFCYHDPAKCSVFNQLSWHNIQMFFSAAFSNTSAFV